MYSIELIKTVHRRKINKRIELEQAPCADGHRPPNPVYTTQVQIAYNKFTTITNFRNMVDIVNNYFQDGLDDWRRNVYHTLFIELLCCFC